jgi:hypothetical protein
MNRLLVALLGLAIGCGLGWTFPPLIYPWHELALSTAGPEEVGHLMQIFGMCIAGPIGFFIALWFAVNWLPPSPPAHHLVKEYDSHKVVDNLD